jgi:hypothetical protein
MSLSVLLCLRDLAAGKADSDITGSGGKYRDVPLSQARLSQARLGQARPAMIRPPARRRLLVALAVILAVALVAGTDGWIVRHFGAHAANEQGSDSYLDAIACPSTATCWAVGQTATTRGGNTSSEQRAQLIEREVAGHWANVAAPRVPEANPALTAITCPGAQDCWAVGGSSTSGSAIIEHWTGSAWQLVRSPYLAGGQLENVGCAGPDLCWATGGKQSRLNVTSNVLEQWDGSRWSIIPALPGGMHPVLLSCPISGHCLILGLRNGTAAATSYTLGQWRPAAMPGGLPAGRLPIFLACSAANDCLTILRGSHGMATQEWDGISWAGAAVGVAPYPAALAPYPAGLACSGSGCWLLGASRALQPAALHWQGGRWAQVPLHGTAALGYLGGLACGSACWAVGGKTSTLGDGSSYSRPLIATVPGT